MNKITKNSFPCGRIRRRTFLADVGMGFTGLALGAMLRRDGVVNAAEQKWSLPDGEPHFPPKAKSVIWLFLAGGVSHLETFDPKPALNTYAGKTMSETPFKSALDSPLVGKVRIFIPNDDNGHIRHKLYPLQVGYRRHGKSGVEVSDWWPHVGGVIDDIAVVRSMWTTDNNHSGQLQFHTGRHRLDGFFPTIGAWVHYGLGSQNDNLPQFVVLGNPIDDCCGGTLAHAADYLGPEHDGVSLSVDPKNPLPFATPAADVYRQEQALSNRLIGRLNGLVAAEYPDDRVLRARIRSYELGFKMQTAVPEVVRFSEEGESTRRLYGLDKDITRQFGQLCLTARRLVERGVRFVQIYHGTGGAGQWDAHSNLKSGHTKSCAQVDQPIAGLIRDLKQRGLLDETVVVCGTEFGRTPGVQSGNGRDHHNYGFSCWLAGGGIKGGVAHGRTDEVGFHAVEDRHYVTDIHATVLNQLGLDPRRLEVPGRKRLEIDYGHPIKAIIA